MFWDDRQVVAPDVIGPTSTAYLMSTITGLPPDGRNAGPPLERAQVIAMSTEQQIADTAAELATYAGKVARLGYAPIAPDKLPDPEILHESHTLPVDGADESFESHRVRVLGMIDKRRRVVADMWLRTHEPTDSNGALVSKTFVSWLIDGEIVSVNLTQCGGQDHEIDIRRGLPSEKRQDRSRVATAKERLEALQMAIRVTHSIRNRSPDPNALLAVR